MVITEEEVEKQRRELGRLPSHWRSYLKNEYGLTDYDTNVLVNGGKALVQFYDTVANKIGDAKLVSNWLQQDVMRYLAESGTDMEQYPVKAGDFATLLQAVLRGELTTSRGREVLASMLKSGDSVEKVMKSLGIAKVNSDETTAICQALLEANPKVVADLKQGKQKAVGALIGQAKQKNPNIQPNQVREICLRLVQHM